MPQAVYNPATAGIPAKPHDDDTGEVGTAARPRRGVTPCLRVFLRPRSSAHRKTQPCRTRRRVGPPVSKSVLLETPSAPIRRLLLSPRASEAVDSSAVVFAPRPERRSFHAGAYSSARR